MKLKKKYKTKFDRSVKYFFLMSLFIFIFSLGVLLPYVSLTKANNFTLNNEIASLKDNNDTLKVENGLLDDRYETMELDDLKTR